MTFVRAVIAPLSSDLDEFGQQKLRAAGRLPLPFPRGPPRYMYSTARMMNHRCIASMVGELESVLACIFLIRYLVDTPPPLAYGGPYSRLLADGPSSCVVYPSTDFRCKPGNVNQRPCVISPLHYRLDWVRSGARLFSVNDCQVCRCSNPKLRASGLSSLKLHDGCIFCLSFSPGLYAAGAALQVARASILRHKLVFLSRN